MKRSTLSLAIALTATLNSPLLLAQDEATPEPATATTEAATATAEPKVLVTVNGIAITDADVEKRFLAMYGSRLSQMPPEQATMMREHAMPSIKEELIAKNLLLSAATKENVALDEAKHAEMLAEVLGSIPEGTSAADFYASLNMTETSFKEAITEEVIINTLLEKQTAEIAAITDEESKKFYDENEQQFVEEPSVKASHILVKTEGITDEAEKAKKKAEIEDIRNQLIEKKGENFAELAKAHSECPSSAQGGDLGDFTPGRMVPEFDKAAFSQKVGEIGEIVETNFGYHVIQVTDKTEGGKTSYEDIKSRIAEYLKSEKDNTAIREYIAKLREDAKIEDLSKPAEVTPEPTTGG